MLDIKFVRKNSMVSKSNLLKSEETMTMNEEYLFGKLGLNYSLHHCQVEYLFLSFYS